MTTTIDSHPQSLPAVVEPSRHPEEEDTFGALDGSAATSIVRPHFDLTVLGGNHGTSGGASPTRRRGGRGTTRGAAVRGDASVASTADLASSVGSVMIAPDEAFLKSFTYFPPDSIKSFAGSRNMTTSTTKNHNNNGGRQNNNSNESQRSSNSHSSNSHSTASATVNFGITFGTPVVGTGLFARNKTRLPVAEIDDDSLFALSRIREGDVLKTINGKTLGPSLAGSPQLVMDKMQDALKKDGYLYVTTKNKEDYACDVLLHATIVKPNSILSLKNMGMTVWHWGYLCVKNIENNSMFKATALKETDHILAVNDISCEGVTPEQFADIVQALPREVTITVVRRKNRGNGNFS